MRYTILLLIMTSTYGDGGSVVSHAARSITSFSAGLPDAADLRRLIDEPDHVPLSDSNTSSEVSPSQHTTHRLLGGS